MPTPTKKEGKKFYAEATVRKQFPNNPPPHSYEITFRIRSEGSKRGWSASHGWKKNIKVTDLHKEMLALKAHLTRSVKSPDTLIFKGKKG
jgi:hypothetical protein